VTSQTFPAAAAAAAEFEEEELDDEELGHAETYADYMPAKCESCCLFILTTYSPCVTVVLSICFAFYIITVIIFV